MVLIWKYQKIVRRHFQLEQQLEPEFRSRRKVPFHQTVQNTRQHSSGKSTPLRNQKTKTVERKKKPETIVQNSNYNCCVPTRPIMTTSRVQIGRQSYTYNWLCYSCRPSSAVLELLLGFWFKFSLIGLLLGNLSLSVLYPLGAFRLTGGSQVTPKRQ